MRHRRETPTRATLSRDDIRSAPALTRREPGMFAKHRDEGARVARSTPRAIPATESYGCASKSFGRSTLRTSDSDGDAMAAQRTV